MKKSTCEMVVNLLAGTLLFLLFGALLGGLSGCSSLSFGVGYAPEISAGKEVLLDNPIGYIGGTSEFYRDGELVIEGFARHYSGMMQQETGGGFNLVGVQATIDLTNR